MNTRIAGFTFGSLFVLVGVLGFIPNPLVASDGVFVVNGLHNLVHILTGAVFLIATAKFRGQEDKIIKAVGVAYLLVAILGFLNSDNMLLGVIHINEADRWLHLGLAIAILTTGFVLPNRAVNVEDRRSLGMNRVSQGAE